MDSLDGLMGVMAEDDELNDDDESNPPGGGGGRGDDIGSEGTDDSPDETDDSTESSTISVLIGPNTAAQPPSNHEATNPPPEEFESGGYAPVGPFIGPLQLSGYSGGGAVAPVATAGNTARFITCPAPAKSSPVDPDVMEDRVHLANMEILKRRADEYTQKRLKVSRSIHLPSLPITAFYTLPQFVY